MPEGSPKALYLSFYRTRPKIILHRPPSSFLLFLSMCGVALWSRRITYGWALGCGRKGKGGGGRSTENLGP